MNQHHEHKTDIVEQALMSRLRGLRQMPVDTGELESAITSRVPRPRRFWQRAWRPMTALAASVIVVASVALALSAGSREAHAEPAMMAQIYRDMVSGKVPTHTTENMHDANSAIAAMIDGAIKIPEVPASHTMACCMREVKNRKVACVLFENHGTPVTISVAKATDFKGPRDGVSQITSDNLHMVMMERNGLWICMVSEMPMNELVALSQEIKF